MGTTSNFLKSRVSKPTVGKWSSGFSAVKKYADANEIPIIAVWSNGDKCGHCVNFEESCMQSTFTNWMKKSGCVFWFGYYGDTSKDDKFEGTGFTWTRNGKLTTYPFCRVWWKKGKVDSAKSGDDWTGGTSKGGATFVKKLQSLLKNFKPNSENDSTTPTQPETPAEPSNGNCDGDCGGDCNAVKQELDSLKSEFNTFKSEFESKLNTLSEKIK